MVGKVIGRAVRCGCDVDRPLGGYGVGRTRRYAGRNKMKAAARGGRHVIGDQPQQQQHQPQQPPQQHQRLRPPAPAPDEEEAAPRPPRYQRRRTRRRPRPAGRAPPPTMGAAPPPPAGGAPPLAALVAAALALHCLQVVVATMPPSSAKFYTIHWNSSNPIFRIDNTDNIIDVNRNNMKFEYDQVNLICPVYMPGTRDEEMEKYIIYNVSKDEYETCRITNPNPRIIAVCDKPYKLMYFTITFRPFTPQPGGLEFLPGHDYYFISTSTSDDLHRRIGGRCDTHNMKIVFKVWGPAVQPSPATPPPSPTAAAAPPPPPLPPAVRPSWRPPRTTEPPAAPPPPSTTKKSKAYAGKHPNEVVKSEELTLGGGASAAAEAGRAGVALLLIGAALAAAR